MWRPCQCGAQKPLEAIGQAVNVAHTVLSRPTDLATQGRQEVAYKVGAMGGWMVAMDDAQRGAPHRPALGNTALMLPPPTEKTRWPERTGETRCSEQPCARNRERRPTVERDSKPKTSFWH